MRTTYYTATSLDGFIADQHDSLDWLLSQDHGAPDPDDPGPFAYERFIEPIGAIVMGSTTYEWIQRHHVDRGEPWMYDVPCWVMTTRELRPVEGADVRFASGDVAPVHAAMAEAAGGGDLWVVGGGDLAVAFAAAGLLDEVVVSIAPVTLGAGAPLFPAAYDLRLLDLAQYAAFACARYAVMGSR